MGGHKDKSKTETVQQALMREVKSVAPEVYRDLLKPTFVEVGGAMGKLARLVFGSLGLSPDIAEARAGRLLEGAGAEVPAERRVAPPPELADPLVRHYLLLGDGPELAELRGMYERLLGRSMDRDAVGEAHPGFVGMLREMTPTEARLVRLLTAGEYAMMNVERATPNGHIVPLGVFTLLGDELGLGHLEKSRCLWNLDRLRIIAIDGSATTSGARGAHGTYEQISAAVDAQFGPKATTTGHAGVIRVTPLGQQFLNTCVFSRSR